MPLYARSDVMSVTVSRAHGGCGTAHTRPVKQGAPARTWQLDCPQCQGFLAHDPLWSGTLADVPPTYDEKRNEESANFTFTKNRDDIMTMALAKIAGLPTGGMLAGTVTQTAEQGAGSCSNGHVNFAGVKFCGECGERLGTPAAATVITDAGQVTQVDGGAASPTPAQPARQPRQARVPREAQPRVPRETAAITR
jgi:hypothetical protein